MCRPARSIEYSWVLGELEKAHMRVLDSGCSGSFLNHELVARGYEVYGVDVRPCPEAHPRMKFCKADIMKVPFKKESFDCVIAVSTIEHVGLGAYQDPVCKNGDIVAMKEIHRILKNRGKLLLTVPFASRPLLSWERIYDLRRLNRLTNGFLIEKDEYSVLRRSSEQFTKLAREEAMKEVNLSEGEVRTTVACLSLKKLP